MITSPIRLLAIKAEIARNANDISDRPTERIGSVTAPLPRVTAAMLPLDKQGRPYLQASSYEDTKVLICSLVERFKLLTGYYPAVIELSVLRYMALGCAPRLHHASSSVVIPIHYKLNADFDVLVRGK